MKVARKPWSLGGGQQGAGDLSPCLALRETLTWSPWLLSSQGLADLLTERGWTQLSHKKAHTCLADISTALVTTHEIQCLPVFLISPGKEGPRGFSLVKCFSDPVHLFLQVPSPTRSKRLCGKDSQAWLEVLCSRGVGLVAGCEESGPGWVPDGSWHGGPRARCLSSSSLLLQDVSSHFSGLTARTTDA